MKKIIGVNSDKDFCACCGKQGLAKVVWIENTTDCTVLHYGTTCAAKIMSSAKVKAAISAETIKAADALYNEACMAFDSIKDRKIFDATVRAFLRERNAHETFKGLSHNVYYRSR
jgi:hypothetical protein